MAEQDQTQAEPSGQPPRSPYVPPVRTGGSWPPPGPPPVSPRKSHWGMVIGILIALLVLGGGFIALVWYIGTVAVQGSRPAFTYGGRIALIRLDGVISDGDSGSIFSVSPGSRAVMEYLREAARDSSVKAIVLRINSPGGAAASSQEIHSEVKRIVDKGEKPVIVSMGDVAASGGYYVASAADRIFASPATTTGSIGVVTEFIRYHRLATKYGVDTTALTSGPYKDSGSPFREMREDERKLFQALVNDVYAQFVKDVAAGRGMDEADIRRLADGRVYTGAQAKKLGLIDELGNLYDALRYAAQQTDLNEEQPPVKEYGRTRMAFPLLPGMSGSVQAAALLLTTAASSALGSAALGPPEVRTELVPSVTLR